MSLITMYCFGLFVAYRNLHPIDDYTIRRGAVELQDAYATMGVNSKVWVIGGDYPADTAQAFGGPVNLVVEMDEFPGTDFLLENAYNVFTGSCEIFTLPYTGHDLTELAAKLSLLNEREPTREWKQDSTEADAFRHAQIGGR